MKNVLLYTEAELAVGLKNNDRKSYEYFYDKYGPAMYGVIYRLVLNKEIANGVMTDTFLELRCKMSNYEHSNGSIFLIALNISSSKARQYIEMHFINNQKKYQVS